MAFKVCRFVPAALICWTLTTTYAQATEKLTFSMAADVPPLDLYAFEILQEAYACAGDYAITYETRPAKRALIEADKGIIDGDLLRPRTIDPALQDLIRVEAPVLPYKISAVSKKYNQLPGTQYEDFSNYRVAIIFGHQSTRHIPSFLEHVHQTTDYQKLITLLAHDRIDYGIVIDEPFRRALGLSDNQQIKILSQELESGYFYHYIHKKHIALKDSLETCIQRMRSTGRVQMAIERVKYGFF